MSLDVLPSLLGQSVIGRDQLVELGGAIVLREGLWKYIPPARGAKVVKVMTNTNTETGHDPAPRLFNLASDPGETRNLAPARPERVGAMQARLDAIRTAGRSRQ
jgi:arylsulfatase A-like enzyme